jgi:acetyl esterase/lipase
MGSRQNLLRDEMNDPVLVSMFSNELNVTKDTPPCFMWITRNDDAVSSRNVMALANALLDKEVYFALHIYPNGCHGLGLAKDRNDVSTWSDLASTFLKNLGW